MKLVTKFSNLLETLGAISVVVLEDKYLDDNMKNFIFRVTGTSKLELITLSSKAQEIKEFPSEFFNVELDAEHDNPDVNYIQIKAKDLMNALQSYKSLNLSEPVSVTFTTINAKVRVTVVEQFKEEDEAGNHKTQESIWVYDNIVVKERVISQLNYDFQPVIEPVDIPTTLITLNISTLVPLLSDEAGNTLPSRLNFSDDYVFAVPHTFATLFRNQLPACFKGINLGYQLLNILRKSIQDCDSVIVSRDDVFLLIEYDNTKVFLRYDSKVPDSQIYLRNLNKEHAIVINRLYTKDVLKRLMLTKGNTKMKIDAERGILNVSNNSFSQDIPLVDSKNLEGLGNIEFNLDTSVALKAIVGDDAVFTEMSTDLRIYISKVGSTGYMLCFTDASDAWYSVVQVR